MQKSTFHGGGSTPRPSSSSPPRTPVCKHMYTDMFTGIRIGMYLVQKNLLQLDLIFLRDEHAIHYYRHEDSLE